MIEKITYTRTIPLTQPNSQVEIPWVIESYDINSDGAMDYKILPESSWRGRSGEIEVDLHDVITLFREIDGIISCPEKVEGGIQEPGYELTVWYEGATGATSLKDNDLWTEKGYVPNTMDMFLYKYRERIDLP